MKEYYLHNGQQQFGPLSFEDLKAIGINSRSMIWYKGLKDWMKAAEIEELKDLISETPPPFSKKEETPPPFRKARKILETDYIKEVENKLPNPRLKKVFRLSVVILAIVGFFVLFSKLISSDIKNEKRHPLNYLMLTEPTGAAYPSYYDRPGEIRITGNLVNKAKNTSYKDFVIDVQFLSKTKTPLGHVTHTLFLDKLNLVRQYQLKKNLEIMFQLKQKKLHGNY